MKYRLKEKKSYQNLNTFGDLNIKHLFTKLKFESELRKLRYVNRLSVNA